jgi:CPA1 family monovalent cation:H+ antiporter
MLLRGIVVLEAAPHVRGVITFTWLLLTVLLVAVATRFVRVPYTVALVVAGLALGVSGGVFDVPLTEDLILDVFLPALLFEAGFFLPWNRLRAEIRTISALAIPGVIVGSGIVALVTHWAGLPWGVSLLFGALISATDPVSVLATFRQLGADRRLAVIVEGESLFNDGTALVLFRLVLGVVIAGSVSVAGTAIAFIVSIAGGILLGLGVGYLAALALRHIDDYLVEITTTVLLAYGTFLMAEQVHTTFDGVELGASPVIAVVVLGLVMGNYALRESMSAATRISMHNSWELIGYLANSLIFLLIGLQIHTTTFSRDDLPLILWAIAGVLVSRALVVYAVSGSMNLRLPRGRRIPLAFQHVITWGGLRGAVALAAALSIPAATIPERRIVLLMTFGVVVSTLLVQGMTIRPLVTWLGLRQHGQTPHLLALERLRGQLAAVRAAQRTLAQMRESGELLPDIYAELSAAYEERTRALTAELDALHLSREELRAQRLLTAQRSALQAEREALLALRNRGLLTGSVFRSLVADVDTRLLQLEEPNNASEMDSMLVLPHRDDPERTPSPRDALTRESEQAADDGGAP